LRLKLFLLASLRERLMFLAKVLSKREVAKNCFGFCKEHLICFSLAVDWPKLACGVLCNARHGFGKRTSLCRVKLFRHLLHCFFTFAFLAPKIVCEVTAAMIIAPPVSAQLEGRSPKNRKTQMGFKTGSI
jgi:hypothetical protein